MTKDQELAIIDKAAAALGGNSYLGPWLHDIRAELERDIRSDVHPEPFTPGAAYTIAAAIVEDATRKAAQIIDAATRQAAGITDDAQIDATRTRAGLRAHIERTLKTIEGRL